MALEIALILATTLPSYYEQKTNQANMEVMAEMERQNAVRAQAAAEQQAIAVEQDATARERAMRERNKALLAKNRSRIGAGGLDYSGTPLLVEINNAMNMELDVLQERNNAANEAQNVRYQGHLGYVNHSNQASMYSSRASQYGRAAKNSIYGGLLDYAGQAVGTAGSAAFAVL